MVSQGPRISFNFDFVPMPMCIWDEGITLTAGEFRLLGYLTRHLFRTRGVAVKLTDDEMLNGPWRANDTRFDAGCGMSRNTMKDARDRLIEKGWLDYDEEADTYRLTFEVETTVPESPKEQVSTSDTLQVKVSTSDTPKTLQVSTSDTSHLVSETKTLPPYNPPQAAAAAAAEETWDPDIPPKPGEDRHRYDWRTVELFLGRVINYQKDWEPFVEQRRICEQRGYPLGPRFIRELAEEKLAEFEAKRQRPRYVTPLVEAMRDAVDEIAGGRLVLR